MDPLAQRLRSERERQGLSIRDLSVVTKIREPYIDALERGRYDVLPTVYIRSFVRTLAQAMAIPIPEVNKLMEEVFDLDGGQQPDRLPRTQPPEPEKPAVIAETVQSAGKYAAKGAQRAGEIVVASLDRFKGISTPSFFADQPKALIYGGGGLAVILLVVLFWWLFSGPSGDTGENLGSTAIEIPSVEGEDAIAALADSITLTVEVMDTSWVTITMDGARTRQLTLLPGTAHKWMAKEKFVLSLSNAGGVRFIRDNNPLPLFGQRGQSVREITITRNDVVSSASTLEQGDVSPQPAQTNRPRPRSVRRNRRASRPQMPIITPAPSRDPVQRPSTTDDE